MEIRKKLYQMFIIGTSGGNLEKALAEGVGGVIFFSADIKTERPFKTLISEIRAKALIPPFLAIDQEGGRVERTESLHSGKKYLSQKFAFEEGEEFLAHQTKKLVSEIKSFGINLNFAPCIDVNTNPKNPIIGERAFSDKTEDVICGQKIVIKEHLAQNIIPCVKHFPGHGDADADSHLELPAINLSLAQMEKTHIKPFVAAVNDKVPMVMVAHLFCSCFESQKIPTSQSKTAINYLRNLGFDGVIATDDMVMKAVSEPDAAYRAIMAGCNLLVYRNSADETISVIENLTKISQTDSALRDNIEASFEKISALKHAFKLL